MAQRDAAGVNGSDPQTSHGASHPRVMPNGCLGSPELVLPGLDSGPLMDVGPAADVYALGAILYEVLAGRPRFHAATPLETIRLPVTAEPVLQRDAVSGQSAGARVQVFRCRPT